MLGITNVNEQPILSTLYRQEDSLTNSMYLHEKIAFIETGTTFSETQTIYWGQWELFNDYISNYSVISGISRIQSKRVRNHLRQLRCIEVCGNSSLILFPKYLLMVYLNIKPGKAVGENWAWKGYYKIYQLFHSPPIHSLQTHETINQL